MNLNREASTGAYLATNEQELSNILAVRGWIEDVLQVHVYFEDGSSGDPRGYAAEINGPDSTPVFMFGFEDGAALLKAVNVIKHRSLFVIE